jgi:tRNA pseudouridine55 synthase
VENETLTGVFVVNKPAGWTSHDVVNKIRRIAQIRKVGHLGTLDPAATGVLPLLTGRATRLAQFFRRNDKVYRCTIRFGYSTDTYDADGQPTRPETPVRLSADSLKPLLKTFTGKLQQVPPPVSAKKVGGVPAYKLARRNLPVNLAPADVEIFAIDLLRCEDAEADLEVHCSSGTYIRSLAHDLGTQLGCGAHLKALRRTASGDFDLQQARTISELQQLADEGRLRDALISAAKLLPDIPVEWVDSITVGAIRQGREFRVSPFRSAEPSQFIKAVSRDGELVAIGEAKLPNVYHPTLVL